MAPPEARPTAGARDSKPGAAWESELPGSDELEVSVRNKDPGDSQARADAAAATWADLVVMLSPGGRVSRGAAYNLNQYVGMQKHQPEFDHAPPGAAARYFQSMEFRDLALSKFASPGTIAAYHATPSYQALVAKRQGAAAANDRAEKEEKRLAPELAAAQKAHVDLSAFGIPLGKKLELPECPHRTNLDPQVTDPCRHPDDMVSDIGSAFGEALLQGQGLGGKTGITQELVPLGKSHCPPWAGMMGMCSAMVSLHSDVVEGVGINVSGLTGEAKMIAILTKKYGPQTGSGEALECRNTQTGILLARATEHVWSLPGLYVKYTPLMAPNCSQGLLDIKLKAFLRSADEAEKRHDASVPQL